MWYEASYWMTAVPQGKGSSLKILYDGLMLQAFTISFTIPNFGLFNKLLSFITITYNFKK